jgi:hypothetical protein
MLSVLLLHAVQVMVGVCEVRLLPLMQQQALQQQAMLLLLLQLLLLSL